MNKTTTLRTAALAGGLAVLIGGAVMLPQRTVAQAPPRKDHPMHKGKMPREQHVYLNAAIRALQTAQSNLRKADHDFQGHRINAMKLTDEAIAQLRIALQVDNDRK